MTSHYDAVPGEPAGEPSERRDRRSSHKEDGGSGAGDAVSNAERSASTRQRTSVCLDEVFHVLNDARRRRIIEVVTQTAEPTPVPDLANRIARRSCGENESEEESEDVDVEGEGDGSQAGDLQGRVRADLRHNQLPKLQAVGAIRYDVQRGVVSAGPHTPQFRAYLSSDGESPDQSGRRCRGLVVDAATDPEPGNESE